MIYGPWVMPALLDAFPVSSVGVHAGFPVSRIAIGGTPPAGIICMTSSDAA